MSGWDFWADYDRGAWEPQTKEAIEHFITPGSTYVDIGAWIGPTVLWAAPHAGRVVAVEPDPVAFGCLLKNVLDKNVDFVEGAVADHDGYVTMRAHNEGFGSSMTRMEADGLPPHTWLDQTAEDATRQVPCFTIQSLFKNERIHDCSLIKMDIEGGESEVLPHLIPFLLEHRIPLHLSLHENWWSRPVLLDHFDGFRVEGIWGGFNSVVVVPE
jgi:FkbM family methyltransferase